VIPRVALALAAAALLLLPARSAEGGGKHRKYPKREVAEEVPPDPAVEEAPQEEPRPRFPLYLTYGEAPPASEYGGPAIPRLGELLPLLSPSRFKTEPWGCPDEDGDRLLNRLGYLTRKARLLDDVTEAAGRLARMAESLAAAGEWSAADTVLASTNLQRLELLREEIDEQVLALIARHGKEGSPRLLRLHDGRLPGETGSVAEAALPLLQRARSAEKRVLAYEREILPELERTAADVTSAHRSGQVGFALVVRQLGSLFEARAEHLDQVWRRNELVLDLEDATETLILSREEGR
jgi:hypothetical protein